RKDVDGQRKLEPQRFKGLGEMDAAQLWETTMNPEQRTLLRVTLEDAATADRLFSILMGEDVASRKEWIEDNADDGQNLDMLAARYRGRCVGDLQLEHQIQTSYLDYSMSVIVGRALPYVRDGLKPVHRRILWSMF